MTGAGDLDPELAELMRLEELEREEQAARGGPPPGEFDPELAELERLMAEEVARGATVPGEFDPELAELMALERLEEERRRRDSGLPPV